MKHRVRALSIAACAAAVSLTLGGAHAAGATDPTSGKQVLDGLCADDDVDGPAAAGQVHQVGPHRRNRGVGRREVRERCRVEVQAEDGGGSGVGEQLRSVPLPDARVHHDVPLEVDCPGGPAVGDLVPTEPVVLVPDAGHRPLAGQGQRCGGGHARQRRTARLTS